MQFKNPSLQLNKKYSKYRNYSATEILIYMNKQQIQTFVCNSLTSPSKC